MLDDIIHLKLSSDDLFLLLLNLVRETNQLLRIAREVQYHVIVVTEEEHTVLDWDGCAALASEIVD